MSEEKKIKLLRKTSRGFIITGIIAIILSTIALFFITQYFIADETIESLESSAFLVEKSIEETGSLVKIHPIVSSKIVSELGIESARDTIIFDPHQQEEEPYKQLTIYRSINNKNYEIVVRALVLEADDIILAILYTYIIIFLLVFAAQYMMNRRTTSLVWRPFFENLKRIKKFSIQSKEPIVLVDSDIEEFSELNIEIKNLTNKVLTDYRNLKQFTEDVSHEIQTPLAIIQAKIDNLFDDNGISESQYKELVHISNNARRLATLNKKLILLAKLENQQFDPNTKVNFTELLKKSVEDFEGLATASINIDQADDLTVQLDEHLARTIIDNLLSNAIKYSENGEAIQVFIKGRKLMVSNSGENAIKNPDKLYTRFYRESAEKKSLGLGLAIVKKICDLYNHKVSYSHSNGTHNFQIVFS